LIKNPVKMIVVERLTLCSKFAKNRLSAGLRPDTLGAYRAGRRRRGEGRGREGKGREGYPP